MTLSTPPDSTDKSCIEDNKLMFFAQEHIRAKGLRADTFMLRGVIKDQQDIMQNQSESINDLKSINVVNDTIKSELRTALRTETYNHKKTQKKLTRAQNVVKVLVSACIAFAIAFALK